MHSFYSSLGDVAPQGSKYECAGTCDWDLQPSKLKYSGLLRGGLWELLVRGGMLVVRPVPGSSYEPQVSSYEH